jgi:hypothetical protein
MVVAGALMAVAGAALGGGPVALLAGVLLLWSGVVKLVVLRIWKSTLRGPPAPEDGASSAGLGLAPEQPERRP